MKKHKKIINDKKYKEIKLVSENGLETISTNRALEIANNKGLDLVIVNEEDTPVCKIFDLNKYEYMLKKQHKQHKQPQTKEFKFNIKIGEHDIQYRVNRINKFLNDKNLVKITIPMKGREITHTELAYELIKKILEKIEKEYSFDKNIILNGKNLSCTIKGE